MSEKYKQIDLGYPRRPTDAEYIVEMPDGSRWSVPVQLIADSRDGYYAQDQEDTIGFIHNRSLDGFEIQDWAQNNMTWDEVKEFATKIEIECEAVDYEEGWVNGEKEIRGAL